MICRCQTSILWGLCGPLGGEALICTAHLRHAPATVWTVLIGCMTPFSAQVGDSLEEFLVSATNDAKLRQLMMSMSEAIRTIAFKVSRGAIP